MELHCMLCLRCVQLDLERTNLTYCCCFFVLRESSVWQGMCMWLILAQGFNHKEFNEYFYSESFLRTASTLRSLSQHNNGLRLVFLRLGS